MNAGGVENKVGTQTHHAFQLPKSRLGDGANDYEEQQRCQGDNGGKQPMDMVASTD